MHVMGGVRVDVLTGHRSRRAGGWPGREARGRRLALRRPRTEWRSHATRSVGERARARAEAGEAVAAVVDELSDALYELAHTNAVRVLQLSGTPGDLACWALELLEEQACAVRPPPAGLPPVLAGAGGAGAAGGPGAGRWAFARPAVSRSACGLSYRPWRRRRCLAGLELRRGCWGRGRLCGRPGAARQSSCECAVLGEARGTAPSPPSRARAPLSHPRRPDPADPTPQT